MKIKIFTAFLLIFLGVAGRLFLVEFVGIPNLEIITALSLISGAMLGGFFTFFIPLGIIAISDFYFGNTSIIFFTWSAFAMIGVFGWLLRKRKSFSCYFVAKMTGMGIISSLFFYLYTNFGWWLLTNMYSKDLAGLIQCYIAGLPFFKTNLMGNLFFVPAFTFLALLVWKFYPIIAFKFSAKFKKIIPFEVLN